MQLNAKPAIRAFTSFSPLTRMSQQNYFVDLRSGKWLLNKPGEIALEAHTQTSTSDNGPWVAVIQNH